MMRGYFGIGVYHPKYEVNTGTLWRSAIQLGASYTFVIGKRYKRQASDTAKSWIKIPFFKFLTIDEFFEYGLPYGCRVVAVEMGGESLIDYTHPQQCIYLLGAEDHGLPQGIIDRCHQHISMPGGSYNLAVAGSLVMWDRFTQTHYE